MEPELTPIQQQEDKNSKKKNCCGCCTAAVLVIVLLCLLARGFTFHYVGENQNRSPMYGARNGKNFSYDITYMTQYVEFDISEPNFLNWCKNETASWEPIEIETLLSRPLPDAYMPLINYKDENLLWISRYCRRKPEHETCHPWSKECQHDATGKTNNACFRIVDNGLYYETRSPNGGGVYVLYDRDNNRCYIYGNHN